MTVYTDPTPIMTGVVDVSALVEQPNSTDLVEDASVSVVAQPTDGSLPARTFAATHEQATNKLFYAANVQLPAAGRWQFTIHVEGAAGQGEVSFGADVTESGLLNLPLTLPLLVLLPLAIVIVWLRRAGRTRAPAPARDRPSDTPRVSRISPQRRDADLSSVL